MEWHRTQAGGRKDLGEGFQKEMNSEKSLKEQIGVR